MPAWNDLLREFDQQADDVARGAWLEHRLTQALSGVSARRSGRNVIFYASAFLQKPGAPPPSLQLTHEEINGFMSVMYGMDWSKDLTLILHTPGGVTNAAETVVAYLWSKFKFIEVIVPAFAMSAGTMMALGSNRVVLGRQSQLGPIDPQLPVLGRFVSGRAVVEQFERAKQEILQNLATAHVWAPILQSLGPSLVQEAQNAIDYGELMVRGWLSQRMFATIENSAQKAAHVAKHFNDASRHKSHGRRIDRNEAAAQGVIVEELEADQQLQEEVLTAYHLVTMLFEKSPASKLLASNAGSRWLKNLSVVRPGGQVS